MGRRARTRRVSLNISVDELALRVGISNNTLGNFERTGRCTLETFVRVLETLNALPDLACVLKTQQPRSIEDMRRKEAASTRKRAYTKKRKTPP
jgi:transcriptional regulator with XRE-family HTH domain